MKFMYTNTSIYIKVVIKKGKSIMKLFHVIHMRHIFFGGGGGGLILVEIKYI